MAEAEVLVIGYIHGSARFYVLPESRSRLLKDTKIPASTPTGKALREWLSSLVTPTTPDAPEVSPTENTRTII